MNKEKLVDFVRLLAEESGKVIRPVFGNPNLEIETKSDSTPVTIADRESEEVMRGLIGSHFPDHGIIGEEYGSQNEGAKYVWVLDPIDGTKPFSAGCPLFGTLICLLENGQPILGAINNPVTGQLLIGNNYSAALNGISVKMRNTAVLEEARLLASSLEAPAQYQNGANWERLTQRAGELLTWGDCFGYLMLATGKADIMVDPTMKPWDLMALIPVIRGAGGVITDWQGNDPVIGNSIVAANPILHPMVIEILNA